MSEEIRQTKDAAKAISLHEEQLYEIGENHEPKRELISFSLCGEFYAVDIFYVREIVPMPQFTVIPNVPSHIFGIMNLRGSILPITDLRPIFELAQTPSGEKCKVVVIEWGDVSTGLWTDGTVEAIDVKPSDIQPPLSNLEGKSRQWIIGQISSEGKLIAVLDGERLIHGTKLSEIDRNDKT